jgi:hypothetical protein
MSWYLAKDDRRKTRQVVIELPAGGAQDSKFGSLGLAAKYENLTRQPWCAGYFRTDAEKGPFLLVRADGHVAHLRDSPLRVAFSFYHEPAGGLFGVFVAAESPELRRASQTGHAVFECIYGLDYQDTVERIQDALARDVVHLCFADASTNLSVSSMQPDGTFKEMTPPACRFDRVYPMPDDCRQALVQQLRELMGYHSSLPPSRRDYQGSMEQMSADFPPSEHPVLGRSHATGTSPSRPSFLKRLFGGASQPPQSSSTNTTVLPFDKLEHIVIFARRHVESFKPSDEMFRVLEQMTGRTVEEIRHKASFQLFRNSGDTIDTAKKGERVSIIAATELAMKGADSPAEKAKRAMAYSQNASERYFRDSSSGEDFAIVLLYGV